MPVNWRTNWESLKINTIFEFLLFTFADDPQATQFAREQLREHVARLTTGFPVTLHWRSQPPRASSRRVMPA